RSLWLDFDGRGLTARDNIGGSFRRGWRLSMGPESRLGRAAVDGKDQFITRLDGGAGDGIEIRQTRAAIVAESRMDRIGAAIPAVGWDHDFQSVVAHLVLPAGWRLFHVSGADTVSRSWVRNWTLLDLFLVLITGIGIGKLFGLRAGALALATLVLVFPEAGAPRWVWLAVLIGEALVRALPPGSIRRAAAVFRLGAWLGLVLVAIPFAVHHVRVGLHPALAAEGADDSRSGLYRFQALTTELPQGAGGEGRDSALADEGYLAKGEGIAGLLGTGSGGGAKDEEKPERLKSWGGKRGGSRRSADAQNLQSYDPSIVV